MAPGAHAGSLLAGVAICAAIFKAGWLGAFRFFLLRRWALMALAALTFGLLTHVFSMTATIDIAATGRDAVVAGRSEGIERHKRALAAYEDAKARRSTAPATRAIAAIRAEMATVEAEIAEHTRREMAERSTMCGQRCAELSARGTRLRRVGLPYERSWQSPLRPQRRTQTSRLQKLHWKRPWHRAQPIHKRRP
jgi:hypothetical protein